MVSFGNVVLPRHGPMGEDVFDLEGNVNYYILYFKTTSNQKQGATC